jgi:hypothetical protein
MYGPNESARARYFVISQALRVERQIKGDEDEFENMFVWCSERRRSRYLEVFDIP